MSINPIEVTGAWRRGWALDYHTLSSEFLGYDQHGNAQFETKRSQLGESLYQLKYRQEYDQAKIVARMMYDFIVNTPPFQSRIDLIVPMPSSTQRPRQPVEEMAKELGVLINIPVDVQAIVKVRETPGLKGIFDPEQRRELLDGAFAANADALKEKGILLVDDFFRSGATANAVTVSLIAAGASRVYLLAATRTRTHT
jgi:competence protein ComFC